MEITITGIQYQMDSTDPQRRIELANELVRTTPYGTPVTLRAEPDNPYDSNAIAVYMDYRRIGYVSSEDALLVRPCLHSDGTLSAPLVRGEDKTMWCEVEVDDNAVERIKNMPRRIQASPFVEEVQMAFCKEELELELVAESLVGWKLQRRTLAEFRKKVNIYLDICSLSLCRMDALWQRLIHSKLREALKLRLLSSSDREALSMQEVLLGANLSNFHKVQGHGSVLWDQMQRLSLSPERETFFQRFDSYYLREPLADAPTEAVAEWEQRLQQWLEETVGAEVRAKEWDEDRLGHKLRYLNLSRREMYDILSVMLLLERLRGRLSHSDALELNGEERRALRRLLNMVSSTPWAEPANDENISLFFRTLFGEEPRRLRAADRRWVSEFRQFFTRGRSGQTERLETAYANIVGYLLRHGLVEGTFLEISRSVFGTERQRDSINKGKNPPAKSRLAELEPTMDFYLERFVRCKK